MKTITFHTRCHFIFLYSGSSSIFLVVLFFLCLGPTDLSLLILFLQVSDDDSYISDVSDSISMDTYSNEGGSERHNSGKQRTDE